MKLEIREVLAAAYANQRLPPVMHSHGVVVDDAGHEVAVLCKKVKLDHLADAGSLDAGKVDGPPTCPACLPKWRKLGGRS